MAPDTIRYIARAQQQHNTTNQQYSGFGQKWLPEARAAHPNAWWPPKLYQQEDIKHQQPTIL